MAEKDGFIQFLIVKYPLNNTIILQSKVMLHVVNALLRIPS